MSARDRRLMEPLSPSDMALLRRLEESAKQPRDTTRDEARLARAQAKRQRRAAGRAK